MLYKYKAMQKKTGKTVQGSLNRNSRTEALQALKQEGLLVMELKEGNLANLPIKLPPFLTFGSPVKRNEFVAFCRQLATLIQSGTTLLESLRLLSVQAESVSFKAAIDDIIQRMKAGQPFSEACQEHPRIFNKMFIYMVKAGEVSGKMDEILLSLAVYFEKEHYTFEKVKSALTYPVLVSIISIFVIIFLLTSVIPKLVQNLVSTGANIPLPTAILIAISNFIRDYWILLIMLILASFITLGYVYRQPRSRYYIDYYKLRVPIFGPLFVKSSMARLSRTFASLITSAVPILQSISMVAEVVGNAAIAQVLQESRKSIRAGNTFSEPLSKSRVIPALVVHMVKVGEETGRLDVMMEKVADFYEAEVEHTTARLQTLIEPIMLIILAIVVGVIVLAALLPVFEIYKNV